MKTLTPEQIKNLGELLGLTAEQEIHCGDFLRHVGEYARATQERTPLDETLQLVHQHTTVCPECREEFEALMKILKAGQ